MKARHTRKTDIIRVEWDYAKTLIQPSTERYKHREVMGVRWASNGAVTLENCGVYSTLNEMEYSLKKGGKFKVSYVHCVEDTEELLEDARNIIKNCLDTIDDVYKGTNLHDFHTKPLRQWLAQAREVCGTDGESEEKRAGRTPQGLD
jgi:hypothetical protein